MVVVHASANPRETFHRFFEPPKKRFCFNESSWWTSTPIDSYQCSSFMTDITPSAMDLVLKRFFDPLVGKKRIVSSKSMSVGGPFSRASATDTRTAYCTRHHERTFFTIIKRGSCNKHPKICRWRGVRTAPRDGPLTFLGVILDVTSGAPRSKNRRSGAKRNVRPSRGR